MILVITMRERNERTGREQVIASHGVNLDTDENVVLPCETPESLGARFDTTYNEFVMD